MEATESKPKVYLPVGNLGTGKTRLAKSMEKYAAVRVISYDAVQDFYFKNEEFYDVRNMVQDITLDTLRVFLANGCDVFMDETNAGYNRRMAILSVAQAYGAEIVFIQMPLFSMEEAVQNRIKDDDRGIDCERWAGIFMEIDACMRKNSNIARVVAESCTGEHRIIALKKDWIDSEVETVLKIAGKL